jgi:hypothetical protein
VCRLLVPTTSDVTCLWKSHAAVGARFAARGTPPPQLCFVLEEGLAKAMVRVGGGKGFVGQPASIKLKEIAFFCCVGQVSSRTRSVLVCLENSTITKAQVYRY